MNFENKKIIQLGDILDSRDRIYETNESIKYDDMILFRLLCEMKKTFPLNIILILGNHEYLNCLRVYTYVSSFSSRNDSEYEYILRHVLKYFQYFYIDEYRNLYIHASLPIDAMCTHDLIEIDKYLRENWL
jgi:hypothetical protein